MRQGATAHLISPNARPLHDQDEKLNDHNELQLPYQSGGRTSGLRHARAGRFSAARRRTASYRAHESVTRVAGRRGPLLPLRYGRHRLAAFEPQPDYDLAAGAGGQAG
jgi:hypothetical protein